MKVTDNYSEVTIKHQKIWALTTWMKNVISLFFYNVLTVLIMCLGKLRKRLKLYYNPTRSGVCKVSNNGDAFYDECCDCGLEHRDRIMSLKELKWLALRPVGYSYKWRLKDKKKR